MSQIDVGDTYELLGTDTRFEIMDTRNGYWILKVYAASAPAHSTVPVDMARQDLADSVCEGKLTKV